MITVTQDDIDALLNMSDADFEKSYLVIQHDIASFGNWLLDNEDRGPPELVLENKEKIKEAKEWLELCDKISIQRKSKKSCIGCANGELNQQGHFGGCLPDPLDSL